LKLLPEETRRYVPAVMAHSAPAAAQNAKLIFALVSPQ